MDRRDPRCRRDPTDPTDPTDPSAEPGQALRDERDDLGRQLERLEADLAGLVAASAESNADDEHDPEGATIAFERSQLLAVTAVTRNRLADVDHALERLAAGTWGHCEACGEPVGAERLAARPAARTCLACARLQGDRRR